MMIYQGKQGQAQEGSLVFWGARLRCSAVAGRRAIADNGGVSLCVTVGILWIRWRESV